MKLSEGFQTLRMNRPFLPGKPKVKLVRSNGSKGTYLVAKRNISKGERVVIYWGHILDPDEPYRRWVRDQGEPSLYQSWSKYLRGLDSGEIVDGSQALTVTDIGLQGVYVNDIQMLNSTDVDDLRKYVQSEAKCNLTVVHSPEHPFPIYQARRKIHKGEILSVHYGLGYWLLQLGVPPQDIAGHINKIM